MEKSMTISVMCKDEATKAKYESLALKMREDSEFQTELKNCKSEKAVYDLYIKHGYTDMDEASFMTEFKDMIDSLVSVQPEETVELTEDELDNVVGGFGWFDAFCTLADLIPVAGPIISGVSKAIKAGVEGKGAGEVLLHIGVGLALAAVDYAVMTATAGIGTAASKGSKALEGAANAVLDFLVDQYKDQLAQGITNVYNALA